ncbi:MAG: DUF86 domain-containing protein [Candidatus Heimdallarchaeum endolithica]|uniref:DUF86 domain-containing protein n=1 Tax=Candidatus Heimdallarchaeum endolithica TaxID=2876572 RepID=A0A9Y1BR76_9ARCH|nr:MAG: DUF86 domain-containing protein [Candidatus Heimdallarchaeum endolithica]
MNVDIEETIDKLKFIEQLRNELFEELQQEKISNSLRSQLIIERAVQLIIQTILDIGAHIISRTTDISPKSYSDIIPLLVEKKIMSIKLGNQLEKISGLRNILVHDYTKIDAELLKDHAYSILTDSKLFIEEIKQFIREKEQTKT